MEKKHTLILLGAFLILSLAITNVAQAQLNILG